VLWSKAAFYSSLLIFCPEETTMHNHEDAPDYKPVR